MASIEFAPRQHETENITAHVIWMTSGLSCDGDSVAMTSAVNPSLEDIITGAIPGMPKVVAHTPVLAYENGAEFMQAWYDAEAGKQGIDAERPCDPAGTEDNADCRQKKAGMQGGFAPSGDRTDKGHVVRRERRILRD